MYVCYNMLNIRIIQRACYKEQTTNLFYGERIGDSPTIVTNSMCSY